MSSDGYAPRRVDFAVLAAGEPSIFPLRSSDTASRSPCTVQGLSRNGDDLSIPLRVRLFSEMFYYSAARLVSLFRNNPVIGIPGFECRPITDIRNLLIEHPEGANGQPVISYGWRHDDGRGPTFEGRYHDKLQLVVRDVGLFRNAETLRERLENALRGGPVVQ
jgi:hypothetical protein